MNAKGFDTEEKTKRFFYFLEDKKEEVSDLTSFTIAELEKVNKGSILVLERVSSIRKTQKEVIMG